MLRHGAKGVALSGILQYFYLGVVEGVRRGTAVADREELLVVVVRLGADHERGEVDVLAEPLWNDELLDLLHDEARQLERAQVARLLGQRVVHGELGDALGLLEQQLVHEVPRDVEERLRHVAGEGLVRIPVIGVEFKFKILVS